MMRVLASILLPCVVSYLLMPPLAHAAGVPEDKQAPRVMHEVVQKGVIGQNVELRVKLQDQSDIFEPKVYFRRVGELEYNTIDLVRGPKDEWIGVIPATFVTRDIEYFLEAYDIMGNGPSRHGGPDRPHIIKISTRIEPLPQPNPPPNVNQPRNIDNGQVKPGQIDVAQNPQPAETPVSRKWWFWTIMSVLIAGALAGGAVGIYYGVTASKGTTTTAPDKVTVKIDAPDLREGL